MDLLDKYLDGKLAKGKLHFGQLKLFGQHKLPLAIMLGLHKGKKAFISGGNQGDEVNGIRLVQIMMHSLNPKQLHGDIIFLPVMDVSGFHAKTRTMVEDKMDLNRAFGKGTSFSNKVAHVIFTRVIKICDFGIDCHDSGKHDVLIPHARIHIDDKGKYHHGSTLPHGKLFGTDVLLERPGKPGMLAIEAFKKLGKPVLTVETGGGLVLWPKFLKIGERGIKNILIHNQMLKGKIVTPKKQYIIKDLDRMSYNSPIEGILHKRVKIGDDVHQGELIASIHDPLTEETKQIISKHCGFVFSLKLRDKVNKGENICSILQTNACSIHKTEKHKSVVEASL